MCGVDRICLSKAVRTVEGNKESIKIAIVRLNLENNDGTYWIEIRFVLWQSYDSFAWHAHVLDIGLVMFIVVLAALLYVKRTISIGLADAADDVTILKRFGQALQGLNSACIQKRVDYIYSL